MKKILTILLLVLGFNLSAQKKPNILWVITDDHRADAIEYYNEVTTGKSESPLGYVLSPNINELCKEGTLFTNAYCNSPMCTPSRSSMQSGRYPFRSGHYKFKSHQTAGHVKPTVSQTLREEGYGTAVFGKTGWGIRHKDGDKGFYDHTINFSRDLQQRGFGDIFGAGAKYSFPEGILTLHQLKETALYPDGTKFTYLTLKDDGEIPQEDKEIKTKVEKDFNILRAYTRINTGLILGGENPMPAGKTVDGYIVEELKNYLANQDQDFKTLAGKEVRGADSHKPLMINLGFHLPHTPVLPPKEFRDKFKKKKYNIPEFSTDELSNFPPQLVTLYNECKTDQMTNAEKLQAIRDYYAFCAYGDALIGESVEAFKQYCKKNNQEYLIVFTVGDHGWHLGEQGIMAKFGPWKQSVHNAAIIVASNKEKFPEGRVVTDMVEFVDFVPTMLSAAGVDIEQQKFSYLDGYDLSRVIEKPEETKREYIIGEVNVVCGHRAYMRNKDFAFSMRTRDRWDVAYTEDLNKDIMWALTCDRPKADLALYDLRKDPLEKENVANEQEYRDLADWFRNKLGRIVLGDGRVECDWTKPNSYALSNFASGSDDKKLDIPVGLIPPVNY
ncbi:sulfatase-like hydrolase/transferase [Reichenbachiella versicolor]|uniref:sulfatase-like hydrolase/transferase n=1 Tax=Reichenbachiella versicolor TaxID=1821036 RepID=UPI000D6E02E2|nr:sulfatase-like hydrolase/transferase [Reichenbachiella versicolor]